MKRAEVIVFLVGILLGSLLPDLPTCVERWRSGIGKDYVSLALAIVVGAGALMILAAEE